MRDIPAFFPQLRRLVIRGSCRSRRLYAELKELGWWPVIHESWLLDYESDSLAVTHAQVEDSLRRHCDIYWTRSGRRYAGLQAYSTEMYLSQSKVYASDFCPPDLVFAIKVERMKELILREVLGKFWWSPRAP